MKISPQNIPCSFFIFGFHKKNVEESTRASARKRKSFDQCACACLTSCSCVKAVFTVKQELLVLRLCLLHVFSYQGRFHCETRTLGLALVLASRLLLASRPSSR